MGVLNLTTSWTTDFVREVIYQPTTQAVDMSGVVAFETDVYKSKTLGKVNALSRISSEKTSCGFTSNGSASLGEVTLNTSKIAVNVEQCYDDFESTQYNRWLRRGNDVIDLVGTEVEAVIAVIVREGIKNDMFDMVWFSVDTTGSGTLDIFDGFFTRFEDSVDVTKVNIDTTGDLAADEGLGILRQMYNASKPLKSVPRDQKAFMVTCTMYENLLATYENTGTDTGLNRLENGGGELLFRGIPVIEATRWDLVIEQEGLSDPHRAVYVARENLVIGTDTNDPQDIKAWFDEKDELMYIRSYYELGVQFMFGEHIVYAR